MDWDPLLIIWEKLLDLHNNQISHFKIKTNNWQIYLMISQWLLWDKSKQRLVNQHLLMKFFKCQDLNLMKENLIRKYL